MTRKDGGIPGGGRLFVLDNTVKQYDWGSPRMIPELMGAANPGGLPWAELWMGVHPEGPSKVLTGEGPVPLPELIKRDPRRWVGPEIAEKFGTLPFLFKLLAAEKPLSIQAHPNKAQAEEGWARENALGIAPKARERNYRDDNHKPEILAALGPFTAMCGFRRPEEIVRGLERFAGLLPRAEAALRGAFAGLVKNLEGPEETALRAFLGGLFALSPEIRGALGAYARGAGERLGEKHPEYAAEWALTASFAAAYPADPALIAPLYLNLVNLEAGEAIYLPAGALHAYVRGFGVELMANSDNVLRGGLSSKHIDLEELRRILVFAPFKPEILKPAGGPLPAGEGFSCFRYPTPGEEFALFRFSGRGALPLSGPAILAVTAGEARLSCGGEELLLKAGESAFAAPGTGEILLGGNYTLYAAAPGAA